MIDKKKKGYSRPSGRKSDELRQVECEIDYLPNAEGSCLIKFGNTHVVCSASVDERVPPFLRNTGEGWVTAEYGMLPRSTGSRMQRESAKGKQGGRTLEIQRLIGRSLRAVVDMKVLGERQIIIDCDVIKADGGTRTAAITGGYIALYLAMKKIVQERRITKNPIHSQVAAISCGIIDGTPLLDLEYIEDSNADVDANFVLTGDGRIIEVQGTAENEPFSEEELNSMMSLAKKGIGELIELQRNVLGI